jgi:indole-3-glycerol phosphate synthase
MNILDEIFAHKRVDVEAQKRVKTLASVRSEAEATPRPLDFVHALQAVRLHLGRPALIAEVKFASPSKGILVQHPDPYGLAQKYFQAGAAAISVLTDEKYFRGCLQGFPVRSLPDL